MPKKPRKRASSQEEKAARGLLIKKGVYKPKRPRAGITDYFRRLLKRVGDVLTGKASVVTAPTKAAAREYAREKSAGQGTVRVTGKKIIVPTQPGERARFTKRGLRVTRKMGEDTYVREPFRRKINSLADVRSQIKSGDRISVPLFRSKRQGVEWSNLTYEEFATFYREYGPGASKEYQGLSDHIQRFHLEGPSAQDYEDGEDDELKGVEYSASKFSPSRKPKSRGKGRKRAPRKSRGK